MRTALAVAALAFVPFHAGADAFPTAPDQMDKFCEAIGDTPNLAVPPRERMWFTDNCVCPADVGCGHPGAARFRTRLAAAKAMKAEADAREARLERARTAEEVRVTQARVATDALRDALSTCLAQQEQDAANAARVRRESREACFARSHRVYDECYRSHDIGDRYACEGVTAQALTACLAEAGAAPPPITCSGPTSALNSACDVHRLDRATPDSDCYRRQ